MGSRRRRTADPADWDDTDFVDEVDDDDWEYRAPLPADGIRARSTRGAIGEAWWSRRFVTALEESGASGRLSRGRTYARKGQVLSVDLAAGRISGSVQGSRPMPYEVVVAIRPIPDADWDRIEAALAGRAGFAAALLAGRITPEIAGVFEACAIALFPSAGDLSYDCTCPDWDVPCKHIAAVCYLAAEEFDSDPFAYLALRGRDRPSLLAGLRARRAGSSPARMPQAGVPGGSGEDDVDEVADLADLADFWTAGEELDRIHVAPRAGRVSDAAIARLGFSGIAAGPLAVEDLLRPMYLRITQGAERRALA